MNYIFIFRIVFVIIIFTMVFYTTSVETYTNTYIPQQIFMTVPKKPLHPKLQQNVDKLKRKNKDWNIIIYDNKDQEEYIRKNFPQYLSYYQSINPMYGAAKADFFRYLIMYKEGGVYLDIKASIAIPLNILIKKNDKFLYFFADGMDFRKKNIDKYIDINFVGEIVQWCIITKPNNDILKKVIERMIYNIQNYHTEIVYDKDTISKFNKHNISPYIFNVGMDRVFRTTGPLLYTNIVSKYINNKNSRKLSSRFGRRICDENYQTYIYGGKDSYHDSFDKLKKENKNTHLII